ncbi:MAG: hypothetical protein R6U40_04425 [Desulfobacterales bacterium]
MFLIKTDALPLKMSGPFNGKTAGTSSLLRLNTLIETTGFMNI